LLCNACWRIAHPQLGWLYEIAVKSISTKDS
jgi:hypothetical protein